MPIGRNLCEMSWAVSSIGHAMSSSTSILRQQAERAWSTEQDIATKLAVYGTGCQQCHGPVPAGRQQSVCRQQAARAHAHTKLASAAGTSLHAPISDMCCTMLVCNYHDGTAS